MRAVARAARLYMAAQVEAGHICPMSMTNAAVAALAHNASLDRPLAAAHPQPQVRFLRPAGDRQGRRHRRHGADREAGRQRSRRQQHPGDRGRRPHVAADRAQVVPVGADQRRLPGARPDASTGLSCFFMPRLLPDGRKNGMRLMRLKDKLGNRSNATRRGRVRRGGGVAGRRAGAGAADHQRHGDADPPRQRRVVGRADAAGAGRGRPPCPPPPRLRPAR